jgi:hypothetical protein
MRLVSDAAWALMTLWQECRGEPYRGQVAVAEVILTRTETRYASNGTVAGTVLRDRQFSGWNSADPNRIQSALLDDADPLVAQLTRALAEAAAHAILRRRAVHYLNVPLVLTRTGLLPAWATAPGGDPTRCDPARIVAEIAAHTFLAARAA